MTTYVAVRFGAYGILPAVHVSNAEENAQAWLGDDVGVVYTWEGVAPLNLRFTIKNNFITRVN